MPEGHIALGDHEYMLHVERYQQQLVNPLAAKLGTGAGDYDDLDDWSAWVLTDYRAGVSKRDPEEGGFLYADSADTRFEMQLNLAPLVSCTALSTNGIYVPGHAKTELSTDADHQKVSIKFTAPITETVSRVWVLLQAAAGTEITAGFYTDSSGDPGTLVGTAGTYTTQEEAPIPYCIAIAPSAALTAGTVYHVVIEPTDSTDTLTFPLGTGGSSRTSKYYDGTDWLTTVWYGSEYASPFFILDSGGINSGGQVVDIVTFNNATYAASGQQIYKYNTGTGVWAAVGTALGATITDLHVWENELWIGLGDTADMKTMSTGEVFTTETGHQARILTDWRGYLYRSDGSDLYYTTDGSTWKGPIVVGPDDWPIRGLAGLVGIDVFASLDGALAQISYGDNVFWTVRYGGHESTNGRGMVHHEGDLFIPEGYGLVRMTSGGQLLRIGLDQGEGLPALRQGKIYSMASMNNWLLAFVHPGDADGMPTLWAWNHEGWHNLATLPQGIGAGPVYYDRANQRLWLGTGAGFLFYIDLPDSTDNPVRARSATFAPYGWLETDWFHGGLMEIHKDLESLYVSGTLSSGQSVTLYYQDDGSTDWEVFDEFAADREEKRWADLATRPSTRRLKLGVRLRTTSNTGTPDIEAIRLKYHNMMPDRWQFFLPVRVAEFTTMRDGHKVERTVDEQERELRALCTSTAPLEYVDIGGEEYLVKITNAARTVHNHQTYHEGQHYEALWSLTLVQVSVDD